MVVYIACPIQLLIFVRRLLEKGANAAGALDFSTALHFAAYLGYSNIALLLIEHGANIMEVDGSETGRTPLEVAILAGSKEGLDPEEVHMYDTCAAMLVQKMTPCRYSLSCFDQLLSQLHIPCLFKVSETFLFVKTKTNPSSAFKLCWKRNPDASDSRSNTNHL